MYLRSQRRAGAPLAWAASQVAELQNVSASAKGPPKLEAQKASY